MERRSRISLDNPVFQDRMRSRSFRPYVEPARRPTSFDLVEPKRHHQSPPKLVEQSTFAAAQQPAVTIPSSAAEEPFRRLRTPVAVEQPKQKHLPRQSRSKVLKRQQIKKFVREKRTKHRRSQLVPSLLTAMAVFLFMAGVFVLFNSLKTDHTVKAQVKELAKQTKEDDGITDGLPSEDEPPTNNTSYSVAPDLPKFFTIEKLGVHARVKRLGVSSDNVLKAPANIFDVGWYDGSAKPGENGTVVVDGHVSGPTKHGVFYSIGSLKAGDKVQIERGDGKVFNYTVTGTQVYDYDKVDMAKVLTTSVPGKPALNFMTCTGRFNVRTNSFEQRVVVFTTQD